MPSDAVLQSSAQLPLFIGLSPQRASIAKLLPKTYFARTKLVCEIAGTFFEKAKLLGALISQRCSWFAGALLSIKGAPQHCKAILHHNAATQQEYTPNLPFVTPHPNTHVQLWTLSTS
jgi:hypothetical protein